MRLNNTRLTGPQVEQFQLALLDAYSDLDDFDNVFKVRMGKQRQHVALGSGMGAIVFKIIEKAEDESWTTDLLEGMRAARPDNQLMLSFAQQFGLAPAIPARKELQRTINEANGVLDVVPWRTRLGQMENRVCRIKIDTGWPPTYGTGFLLGPDVVMTNYHVIEDVIEDNVKPEKVTFRFDYRRMSDGTTVNPGQTYSLADDWLIAASPYSELDYEPLPAEPGPDFDELDFALLRVDGQPGNDPVSGGVAAEAGAPKRGWIEVPVFAASFAAGSSLFILQHPQGDPLKLALETQSVLGLNGNKTRVRHTTNTDPGSSGSPCFDANWNLIAIHHLGDPNFDPRHDPTFNQAIPISGVMQRLSEEDKLGELGEKPE